MGRNRELLTLLAACLLASASRCSAVDFLWPAFRHDASHTGRSALAGPCSGIAAWSCPLAGSSSSSPVVAGGRVYAAGGGRLSAVGPDGAEIWSAGCGGTGASTPAVASDGTVYIASTDAWLYAFYSDGSLRWKRNLPGLSESSPAIGADGAVCVGCAASKLVAYRPDGTLKFIYTAGGAVASSPAVAPDGTVYFGCDDGCLYALGSTGSLKWKFTTNPVGAVKSSPSVGADGTVYFGTMNGFFYAVRSVGTQRWRYAAGGGIYSSPAVASDGSVVFGCRDRAVYCLTSAGGLRWKVTTGQYVDSSPAIDADGVVYAGSNDGYVYAISAAGATLWTAHVGNAVTGSPAIGDSVLYVTTQAGALVAIRGDDTPPPPPVVVDDGVFTTASGALHASWSCEDPESGVAGYEYAIGTSPGAQNVVPFTAVGTAMQVTRTGLSLVSGVSYYFAVRATNGAGLVGETGLSNGITVDLTPPEVTDVSVNASAEDVRVRVTGADAESGVVAAQCALLTSATETPSNWASGAPGESIVLPGPLDPAKSYYVAARLANGAGLVSAAAIRGPFRADDTPPTTPVVTDDGTYSTSRTSIRASWTSSDPESGIDHYSCWVGTSHEETSAIGWAVTSQTSITFAGLNLVNGATYYVAVRAVNRAGLASELGFSDGIRIDSTPPSDPLVLDDGEVTSASDCLHATISSSDAESGVTGYSYCVGTSPGASDVVGWTQIPNQQWIAVCGLQLQVGTRYYFTAKATNGAGLVSGQSSSDGIEYRRGVSVWSKFRADARNTGRAVGSVPSQGIVRWRVQTGGYVESSAAIGGDGTAYVGSSDGKLYAISAAGTIRWAYHTGSWIDSSPALGSDGSIYVGAYDGLYCIGSSGTLKWRFTTGGMVWSSPSIGPDGTVYFGCHDRRVYAMTPAGVVRWSYLAGGEVWSSPAIASDGTVYFGCGDGKLYALGSDGVLKWTYQTGSAADSSPAIADDGTVYLGSGDGHLYAVTPLGSRVWRAYLGGQVVDSSPAIAEDGTIYVGTGGAGYPGALWAISPSGAELWHVLLPEGVRSSPAVDKAGTVCVGCADGHVCAYTREGALLWSYAAGDAILGSPAIGGDGALVIGSDDGCVYCFRDQAVMDTTPPTRPLVRALKQFIAPDEPIAAWWSSSDAESGIESYSYAIGTQPNTDDIVSWTNAGDATSVSRSGLPLVPGRTYYVSVTATNGGLLKSEAGVSDGITVTSGPQSETAGGAKKRLAGTQVTLSGKIVTAVFDDCIFVEEPNRTSAVRCVLQPTGLQAGSVIGVQGTVGSRYGETVLNDVTVTPAGFSGSVKPVTFPCELLARVGIDSFGLLMRVVGQVTRSGAGYCVLYDGSALWSPRGAEGIEVRLSTQRPPAVGAWVSIEGIPCREIASSQITIVIRAVPGSAVVVY